MTEEEVKIYKELMKEYGFHDCFWFKMLWDIVLINYN